MIAHGFAGPRQLMEEFALVLARAGYIVFVLFATVSGWIGRATWRPAAAGIGLGLGIFLAWALGVTFSMFAA